MNIRERLNRCVDYWEADLEYAVGLATDRGFKLTEKDIGYSGFWSQGDGLAFSSRIDWDKFLAYHKTFAEELPVWYLIITANASDVRVRTILDSRHNGATVDIELDFAHDIIESGLLAGECVDDIGLSWKELEDFIESAHNDVAHDMYKSLQDDYEYCEQAQREGIKEEILEEFREELTEFLNKLVLPCTWAEVKDALEGDIDHEDISELDLLKHVGNGRYDLTETARVFLTPTN